MRAQTLWIFPAMGLVLLGFVLLPTVLLFPPICLTIFASAGPMGLKAFGYQKKTFPTTKSGRGGTFYVKR